MSCSHYACTLTQTDRHFISSQDHNNCVLCLVNDKGNMTQEEIGTYLGLTKMRISQIEKQALQKLEKRKHLFD